MYEDAVKLVIAQDLFELEETVSAVLKNEEYLFQKIIYKMDLADPLLYYYINKQQDGLKL